MLVQEYFKGFLNAVRDSFLLLMLIRWVVRPPLKSLFSPGLTDGCIEHWQVGIYCTASCASLYFAATVVARRWNLHTVWNAHANHSFKSCTSQQIQHIHASSEDALLGTWQGPVPQTSYCAILTSDKNNFVTMKLFRTFQSIRCVCFLSVTLYKS